MRLDTNHCGRTVASAAIVILLSSSCYEAVPPVDEGGGDCAIDNDGEHEPGYPYDLEQFQTEVLPVLTSTCATTGCHGAPGRHQRLHGVDRSRPRQLRVHRDLRVASPASST